jgi:hypothetical protein
MGLYGGGGGGPSAADQAREQEAARQASIGKGMSSIDAAFKRFDDPYYASKEVAYKNYYLPQLDQQFNDARDAMSLRLSANGLGGSTSGATGMSRLGEDYARQKAEVAQRALEYGNQVRTDVQGLRTNLVNQLNSTADPAIAAQAANSAAYNQYSRPNAFEPISNAFKDYAGMYLSDLDRANRSGGTYKGLFDNANSVSNFFKPKQDQGSGRLVG